MSKLKEKEGEEERGKKVKRKGEGRWRGKGKEGEEERGKKVKRKGEGEEQERGR